VDRTAGILVIGNEILSGKVTDTNSPYLTRELRKLGVTVRRILTIPDELDEIAAAVAAFHREYDVVFTSGGVGPTHDDVTMEGVARGLERRVIRHPALESKLREYFKDKVNEARLKMSEVPEGSELIIDGRLGFPTIKCDNVYILPGIPEILEQKFEALRDRFAATPYHLRVVYTSEGEGGIAEHLNATVAAFPELMLGSYPKIGDPEYAVKLTLESKDQDYVERALRHLLELLPRDSVVRTE
jgi:molybdenum cofactor synthesis domain-containing protein